MLLSNNNKLINECNLYKHDGRRERGVDLIERKGFNYRITEMQAALGVAQLGKSERFIKNKKENHKLFSTLLNKIDEVSIFNFNPNGDIVPHRNIIFVPESHSLIKHLVNKGIGARTLFMPMHSQPCYDSKQILLITEKLYATGVCLPSAPSLSNNDIKYICDIIKAFYF